jgi:hypothetical protein
MRVYFLIIFGIIGNYFRIDLATSLQKAKDRGFAISAMATLSLNSFGPEVLIHQLLFLPEREMVARKIRQSFF